MLVTGFRNGHQFLLQVLRGRWFTMFCALLVMSVEGATYMFGSYSNEIKSSLGYDQSTLNTLSFFKNLGAAIGVPSGLMMEVAPPWTVLALSAILNFGGYFMIWLAVTGHITKPTIWQMCIYIFIGTNALTFADTSTLVTCVKNFPTSRGAVIGLLKGYLGLSGAIITQLYFAIYLNDAKGLILLISWLPPAIIILSLFTMGYKKVVKEKNEPKVFYQMLYISLGLAGFLLIMIIVQKQVSFTRSGFIGNGVVVFILLLLPIVIVIKEEYKSWKKMRTQEEPQTVQQQTSVNPHSMGVLGGHEPQTMENSIYYTPSLETNEISLPPSSYTRESSVTQQRNSSSCLHYIFRPIHKGEDYTMIQALLSTEMFTIVTCVICGVVGTQTVLDNLGQIGVSHGYSTKSINTFVSLISIWNYLGRVMAGFGSDHLMKKYRFPRPLMLTFVLVLVCGGHLLIAFGVSNGLYIASIVIGFGLGAQWSLLFAIISDIFGLKYYATLFNVSFVASPLGYYFLNVKLTGKLYDIEAKRQMKELGLVRKAGQELVCKGPKCFRVAFLVIAGVTLFCVLVSLILVVRTKKLYKNEISGSFRVAPAMMDTEMATTIESTDDNMTNDSESIYMSMEEGP